MSYFTERHGMRKPIERTSTITVEMYALLFDCCEKYYDYIAWKFPLECDDGYDCCGLDMQKLSNELKFVIPDLFRNFKGNITIPQNRPSDFYGKENQFALLDLIEYIAQNCRDITHRAHHDVTRELVEEYGFNALSSRDLNGHLNYEHLFFSEKSEVFIKYRSEINHIFEKTGLLFTLTDKKIVERVVENSVLTAEIEAAVKAVKEPGTRELLEEAIGLFKQPDPATRKFAVEKLWDAFERLKTYYTTLDKKASVTKIVNDMSGNQLEFAKLFEDEFNALKSIGNDFRIRHHETNKIDITDDRYYDYFFNRCLSLIALAIQYLN